MVDLPIVFCMFTRPGLLDFGCLLWGWDKRHRMLVLVASSGLSDVNFGAVWKFGTPENSILYHGLSWFIMVLSWFTMSFPIKMLISGATNSLWGSLTVHFFQHSSAFFMGVFGNGVYIIRYTVYHQNDQNANSKRENTFTSYRNGFLLLKMTPPWHT